MPARKYSDDLLNEACRLREAGMAVPRIARRLGMPDTVVEYHCLRLGADSPNAAARQDPVIRVTQYRRNGRVVRRFSEVEDTRLLGLRTQGIGVNEIARQLGRCRNSVIGRLRTLARREARDEARRETRHLSEVKA